MNPAPAATAVSVFPPLPLLKRDSGDVHPVVVMDSREQIPLIFRRLPSVTGTLTSGDYSFLGGEELFSVERKSVGDLVGCCCGPSRERFGRELHRLRGYRFKRLLIVGARAEVDQHRYRSNVSPKVVLHTLAAFEVRYDLPVVWCATPEEAAQTVERWVWWYSREMVQGVNGLLAAAKNGTGNGATEAPTATGICQE